MTALAGEDRVRSLLDAGWQSLDAGRCREASDIFGRVLLQDPARQEARRGLDQSRAALAEEDRRRTSRLEEAQLAFDRNDPDGARRILDSVLKEGGESDAVRRLRDRLDDSGSWREGRPRNPAPEASPDAPLNSRTPTWSRRLLVGAWVVAFGLLATGVASSWDRLVFRLASTPAPLSPLGPTPTQLSAPTAAERDLQEARRLIDQGDLPAAVRTLERIAPEEPSYPFARQLRAQVETALRKTGQAR